MKLIMSAFLLVGFMAIALISCSDSDSSGPSDTFTVPDLVFNANITGAETLDLNFTLKENVATEYAMNGSVSSAAKVFSMVAMKMPTDWQLSLVTDATKLETKTYKTNEGNAISSFMSPSGTGYVSSSGEVTVTKQVNHPGLLKDWYIDGTFTMIMYEAANPDNTITISGSFSGVFISEN